VDISTSVEYNNIERLYRRFEDGQELTDAEVDALVRAGKIGGDEIKESIGSSRGSPVFLLDADPGTEPHY
jgi:hypothetical protein